MHTKDKKSSDKIDYGLKFYNEVLGLEELHWGYFPEKHFPDNERTLGNFKKAQQDYTLHLLSYVPESVHSILDVGCGLGKMAKMLTDKGYKVTCISNDEYQETLIRQKYPSLQFVRTKFEDFATSPQDSMNEHFDLLLMSESVQYLSLDSALKNARRLLNPSGYLLISDYFRKSDTKYYRTCKVLSDFMKASEENSFSLCKEEDITEFVLPTLYFANYCYSKYALPSINILGDYADSQLPRAVISLAKCLFKKWLNKLTYYIGEHTSKKLNSSLFREKVSYVIQLWQLK
ncbi:methyltransferase domain-containing protein [candidate division WOR-3 bacterium]|nr:methyltransferase domain-containing protein [candidate division WOR-3 bacterium]